MGRDDSITGAKSLLSLFVLGQLQVVGYSQTANHSEHSRSCETGH